MATAQAFPFWSMPLPEISGWRIGDGNRIRPTILHTYTTLDFVTLDSPVGHMIYFHYENIPPGS